MAHGANVRQAGDQIEQLLGEVRSMVSPATWDRIDRLMRSIVELYGAGLAQLMNALDAPGADASTVRQRLLADPLIASLLLLHGLHPDDLATRVQQALERVRPYLGSHGGDVEVVATDEDSGVVRLRMEGSCDGCPSSILTVKLAVETAIREAAPEVIRVDVEGLTDHQSSAASAEPANVNGAEPAWVTLDLNGGVTRGRLAATQVHGEHVVVCNVDDRLYAYRNGCPSCGAAIAGGRLDGDHLTCPGCGQAYDVRLAGRAIHTRDLHLDPLPLLEDGGHVKVAVPAE